MYAFNNNHLVCKLPAFLLFVLALGFIMPVAVQAQPIPPVGNPSLSCMGCGTHISSASAGCPNPNCKYSRVQKTKPRPAPARPLNPLPSMVNPQRQPVPDQPDDRLYYDGIVTPGGLKTRHFDPDGLAARAEEWGKEMRQVKDQSQKKQEARNQAFETDKKTLLENQGNGTALNQLKNPFADDPNVVDLRVPTKPTPSIPPMEDKKESGSPIYEGDQNPLVALSDEQLEKKREALGKAISEIAKLQAAVTSGYADLESDAQAGKELAWKAAFDAGTTVTLGLAQEIADKNAVDSLWKAIDINEGGLSPAKIAAMRQAVDEKKVAELVKGGASLVDAIKLAELAGQRKSDPSNADDGDALAQTLPVIGSFFSTPSRFPVAPTGYFSWMSKSKSPIGAIPGAVQSGIDTGLVWVNYWKQACDSSRQEELQKQHNANLQRLTLAQMQVIEEQNRRKRRAASK